MTRRSTFQFTATFVDTFNLGSPFLSIIAREDELDQNVVPTLTCYRFRFGGAGDSPTLDSLTRQVRPRDFVEHVLRQKVEWWA